MNEEELKILEVELRLNGFVVHKCSYSTKNFPEDTPEDIPSHNEPSDTLFKAVNKNMYFKPCKKHLPVYLEAVKRPDWNQHWRVVE